MKAKRSERARARNGAAQRRRRPSGDPAAVTTIRMAPEARVQVDKLVRRLGLPLSTVLRWALSVGVAHLWNEIDALGVVKARQVAQTYTTLV